MRTDDPTMLWPAEQKALTFPRRLLVSAWADAHRIVGMASPRPGPWQTSWSPYLREVMDGFVEPHVDRITMMCAAQVGKTEALLNLIGYVADQDPSPMLFVLPREEDGMKLLSRRIRPMFVDSPRLRKLLHERKADNTQKLLVTDQMALRVTGANSPAGLASDPVRYLLLDEVDKFPPFSGREADPVSLSMERTRTFWDRRVVMTSTPTTRAGSIWREYELSDQRRFHVPCLGCGKFMILESENVRRPGDVRDPDMIEREDLARYICPRCKHEHQEVDKRPMLARGRWVPAGAEVTDGGVVVGDQNSRHRGYQLSALYSPWVSWSAVLAEYLRAKDDVARYMNFVNSWLGWIWEERLEARDAADLLALAAGHASGTVPKGTVVLTAGVDVQADLFYYAIRAWGYGEESWLVECGRVETWEALENAMFRREFKEHGGDEHAAKFSVRQAAIDSGYRTHEVYDFCRRWRAVARPVKGQERLAGMPIKPVRVERDGRGVVIVGGLQLWHVDTNFFKDALAQFWSGDRDGAPARFHLHADPPDEYCRHLASEHKIVIRNRTGAVKEVWSRRPGGGPNHWFDAEVYAMAAAHMLGVFGLRRPDGPSEAPIDPERDERAPKPWAAAGRPAAQWVGKRRGGRWVR